MVCFFTFAYNAEQTLHRAVDSILNQTYSDWIYYLCENGSTDNTRKIVEEYEKKDSRIIPIYMDVNNPYEASKIGFSRIFGSDMEYFCMLDADDEYSPAFLEKTLAFMEENDLDAAACGNDFIDSRTDRVVGARKLNGNLILENAEGYNKNFFAYHQFTRTIWGKIYKVSLFKTFDFTSDSWDYYSIAYGGDTLFCMKAFSYARRVGILSESLHKYYLSNKSSSYQFNKNRIYADAILFDAACDFLNAKCGSISPQNYAFLLLIYMNAIKDTLQVVLNSQISTEDKLSNVIAVMMHKYTIQLITEDFSVLLGIAEQNQASKKQLFKAVLQWMQTLDSIPDELMEQFYEVGTILAAACEDSDSWLYFNKINIQFLYYTNKIECANEKLNELLELVPNDKDLLSLKAALN